MAVVRTASWYALEHRTMPDFAYADNICRPAAIPDFMFLFLFLVYRFEIEWVRVVERKKRYLTFDSTGKCSLEA